MKGLPLWARNVNFEVPMWTPYGLDYKPVSFLGGTDELIRDIATYAMELESELVYLRGMNYGEVGVVSYDKTIDPGRDMVFPMGFMMLFSYSRTMETFVSSLVKEVEDIKVGICFCDLKDRKMRLGKCKAIALISSDPFFDERTFLERFTRELENEVSTNETSSLSFYAEKFGYRRFFIPYETDDLVELAILDICSKLEVEETKYILDLPKP